MYGNIATFDGPHLCFFFFFRSIDLKVSVSLKFDEYFSEKLVLVKISEKKNVNWLLSVTHLE